MNRNDQSDEEPTSNGDSVVLFLHKELRRQLTRKEKGKKKMPEYDTSREELDRSESDSWKDIDGTSEMKSELAKRVYNRRIRSFADLPTKLTP